MSKRDFREDIKKIIRRAKRGDRIPPVNLAGQSYRTGESVTLAPCPLICPACGRIYDIGSEVFDIDGLLCCPTCGATLQKIR